MERVPITTDDARSAPSAGDLAVEACWNALLVLRTRMQADPSGFRHCSLRVAHEQVVTFDARPESSPGAYDAVIAFDAGLSGRRHETLLVVKDLIDVEVVQRGAMPESALALLRLYLPYCLAPIEARRRRRAIAVSHFAHTLDGRIATQGGDSRWIGCPENLVHAHRMRALCDAVLIGAGTLRRDRPRLNVRHVPGIDPIRIVIGSGPLDLSCLTECSSTPVLTIGRDQSLDLTTAAGGQRRVEGRALLEALFARGIHSVLVEGGAATTTALLADGAIDVVQLHIEPLLLGSGLTPFTRPPVELIADALTFRSQTFVPVGTGVMFIGCPA
jgi:diaminohydroxyphosphoribosylaminopyrimidine deaminase / 5-amino-6-(5-phosphoribosylamino)uracil reductase